jgi:hypothetical protein
MNDGIISKAISTHIAEAHFEEAEKSSEYITVNVRPGEKISAMIDVFLRITKKSPSALFFEPLPRKIAQYAASSPLYADAILNSAEQIVSKHGFIIDEKSALGILEKKKILEVEDMEGPNIEFSR